MSDFAAIVWKELFQTAHRRRFVVERSLVVLFSAVLFVSMAYAFIYDRDSVDYRAMSVFSQAFSASLGGTLLIVLSLAATVYAADNVSSEYSRHTMVFLLVTPLSPTTILASKLVAVCIRLLVGLLLALPVIALLPAMGGVDWRMIAGGAIGIMSNVLVYGSLGIRAGALERTPTRAIVRAVIYAFIWYFFGTNIMGAVFFGLMFGRTSFLTGFLAVSFVNVLIASGLLFLNVRSFRRRALMFLEGEEKRPVLTPQPPRKRWFTAKKYPLSRIARRFIPPGMTLKELATWDLASALLLPALFCIIWGFGMIIAYNDNRYDWALIWFGPTRSFEVFAVEGCLLVLALSIMASTRIAAERQAGTLATLGLTLLTPFRILAGKAAGVLLAQLPAIAFFLAHAVLILALRIVPARLGPVFFLSAVLAPLFAVTLGLYFSLPAKSKAASALAVLTISVAGFVAIFPSAFLSEILPQFGLRNYAVMPIVMSLLLFLILARGRRRGLHSAVHWVSYVMVLASCVAALDMFLKYQLFHSKNDAIPPLGFTPFGGVFWLDIPQTSSSAAIYVFPVQIVLFAWMVTVCLSTFNAQLRRAA